MFFESTSNNFLTSFIRKGVKCVKFPQWNNKILSFPTSYMAISLLQSQSPRSHILSGKFVDVVTACTPRETKTKSLMRFSGSKF